MTHLSDIPQVLKSDLHKFRSQTATDLKTSDESSIRTVEISFYDHEIHVDDKLIARITHDHSDFVTQRWVVVINDVEIHRANTWMKCCDYIIWHYKKGTLPKQQQEVEPVNTDNEQMAQIATECKKFGFDLHDSGIYYNSVKLGEVGCTDGKWWVVRASSQHQLQVLCNSISDAVWSLWMVEVFTIEATQITSITDTNNENCEELLDKPFDELISEEWERLRKYEPLPKSTALFSALKPIKLELTQTVKSLLCVLIE